MAYHQLTFWLAEMYGEMVWLNSDRVTKQIVSLTSFYPNDTKPFFSCFRSVEYNETMENGLLLEDGMQGYKVVTPKEAEHVLHDNEVFVYFEDVPLPVIIPTNCLDCYPCFSRK